MTEDPAYAVSIAVAAVAVGARRWLRWMVCGRRSVQWGGSVFFFSSRRRHTRCSRDWSSDVCSSDLSDPAVRLADVAGRLGVIGDSMEVRLARVGLPRSALRDARGTVRWPHGTLLFDLRLLADSATLEDFRFIDRRFAGVPGTGVVSGDVRVRSHGERVLEVGLDPLRLAYGGGTVAGRLVAFSAADSGLVVLRDADLDAREFDLEFARPFLDTLPFAGRLSGHTAATGPLAGLALETDWSFRDSLVAGWPETRIRGKGEVNLKAADGLRFQPFAVETSSIDLGTVARLAPAVRLHGTLAAVGTLTGPLRNAQLVGTLDPRDGDGPPAAPR